ncbi:MAG: hypothetical protein H6732_15455 [Alphaproteobacteria bacterium]|nr:hypothetical protein [Alphaproteobacteria bacterium]
MPDDVLAAFAAEALYAPEAWFVHRVLSLDPEAGVLVAEMDTTALPLVPAQRVVPGHPQHLPAAVAVQATGTLGQIYAVTALGLRVSEGWVGYGTHIEQARWGRMGEIGPPIRLTTTLTRQRTMMGTRFAWFDFLFEQHGQWVYRSRQAAAWRRVTEDAPA